MRKIFSVLFSAAAFAASAAPVAVSGVAWDQDEDSHIVKVSYTLDEHAIVTVEVLTNGVAMKGVTHLAGDVCKFVEKGDRSFLWAVEGSHPGIAALPENSEIRVLAWRKSDPPDYLVVSLTATNDLSYYPGEDALPFGIGSKNYRHEAMVMRRVRAKNVTWRMGSPETEFGVNKWSSETAHPVTHTNDYYIGVFEVTLGQYQCVQPSSAGVLVSGHFVQGELDMILQRPKDSMAYDSIRGKTLGANWPNGDYESAHAVDEGSVVHLFRAMTGIKNLDLPTEAQWEFACRAGTTSGLSSGYDITSENNTCKRMGALGRYVKNGGSYTAENVHSSTGGTARVGSYQPNAWGIYDMHGNLREWCLDWLGEYPQAAAVAPAGPPTGTSRAVRGGGYSDGPYSCRSANRGSATSKTEWAQLGFRLAADILPEGEAEAGAEE